MLHGSAPGGVLEGSGGVLGASWAVLGRSWGGLGRSWGGLGTTRKNHQKIDAQNDPFWLPKGAQNGTQNGPKSDPKSMQKTDRKKNRTKTKIGPLKTQKVLFFLRKKQQKSKNDKYGF